LVKVLRDQPDLSVAPTSAIDRGSNSPRSRVVGDGETHLAADFGTALAYDAGHHPHPLVQVDQCHGERRLLGVLPEGPVRDRVGVDRPYAGRGEPGEVGREAVRAHHSRVEDRAATAVAALQA
jgi:hypothetical protein